MLPPDGSGFHHSDTKKRAWARTEAIKVLTQIHDYMDQHMARYGYIVNNEELIFFRR